MKRSRFKKAGTVLLTTATGLCWFASGVSFGQDPSSNGSDIQRRLAQMYAREGKAVPGQPTTPKSNPQPPHQRQTQQSNPFAPVPSGITAPVNGSPPVVNSAKPSPAKPAPFPKTERWPSADPAPPVPAITPGPSSHPLLSTSATHESARAQQSTAHPLAESASAPSLELDSGSPSHHPLASPAPSDATFEMPVFAEPMEQKTAENTVLTPPIAPHETGDDFEAEWQNQVEHELAKPVPEPKSVAIPLAPPAASQSENPFEQLPLASGPVVEAQATQVSAPGTEKVAAPKVVGLRGCCPVTLRDNRMEAPGRSEHQCEWQGVTYRLASAEAKARFEAHPEHYAPAHGGCDVTLTSQQGQQSPGSLEHAIWYRKQLYLFRDASSLKSFTANPAKYVK